MQVWVPVHDTGPIKAAIHIFPAESLTVDIQRTCLKIFVTTATTKCHSVVCTILCIYAAGAVAETFLFCYTVHMTLAWFSTSGISLLPAIPAEMKPVSRSRKHKKVYHYGF
jgi:hypothetical protein